MDQARYNIFWANFKKKRIVDLSLIPPCTKSLKLHSARANYVARMWRHASSPKLELESPTLHGWDTDLSLKWVEQPYPDDIAELLVQQTETDDEEIIVTPDEIVVDEEDGDDSDEELCARMDICNER